LQQTEGLIFLQKIVPIVGLHNSSYRVTGLAILDNELFAANASNVVEVIDLRTLEFKRQFRAEEMTAVIDMGASARDKYVYLLCSSKPVGDGPDEVHMLRFSVKGVLIVKRKLESVSVAAQISVTDESNALLTDCSGNKLMEYSSDLALIRVISLKWESGIKNPVHAIKLTSDHFVVSHGNGYNTLHRVCIVDIDSNVLKSFGVGEVGKPEKLNTPVYMEMFANGNILVADNLYQRLLILSSSLEFVQELSPKKSKQQHLGESTNQSRPWKLILDEANSRLFVSENIWSQRQDSQYGDQLSAFTFSMQ